VIGGGTRLAEVYDGLAGHGRTIPVGCGPTVGIAGLTLGGGLGILGRRYGPTCDSLLAATLVLADGRVIKAGDDLLWGVAGRRPTRRGHLADVHDRARPGHHRPPAPLPAPAATDVLDARQHAKPDLDDTLAPSLVVTTPPAPALPPIVTVFGAAPDTATVDHLIRRLGERPASDERQHGTHRAAKRWLAADDAVHTRFAYLHSEYFPHGGAGSGADRPAHRGPAAARGTRVGLLAVGRRVQPGTRGRDRLPMPGRPVPAQADRHRRGRRAARRLAGRVIRAHPPVRHWRRLPPEPGPSDQAYHLGNTGRLRRIRAVYDPQAVFAAS
jgi:hypothetical protein